MRKRPAMQRSTVVLPQPDGPNSADDALAPARSKPASRANLPPVPARSARGSPDGRSRAARVNASRTGSSPGSPRRRRRPCRPRAGGLAPSHRLDKVEDRGRHDARPAGDVAANHEDDAELADCVAKPSTAPVSGPGLASGRATSRRRDGGEARKVEATSSAGRPRRRRRRGSAAPQTASTRGSSR